MCMDLIKGQEGRNPPAQGAYKCIHYSVEAFKDMVLNIYETYTALTYW